MLNEHLLQLWSLKHLALTSCDNALFVRWQKLHFYSCGKESYQDIPVWICSTVNWTEQHNYSLTIHRRVDQDTEPWRACIQPCHDNRHFRTFLIIMIMETHSPVPTRTPPTIFWLSVDIYRLWTETKREGETINVKEQLRDLAQSKVNRAPLNYNW